MGFAIYKLRQMIQFKEPRGCGNWGGGRGTRPLPTIVLINYLFIKCLSRQTGRGGGRAFFHILLVPGNQHCDLRSKKKRKRENKIFKRARYRQLPPLKVWCYLES